MHPVDVDASLKSMVCLVDTKEQDTPALRKRLKDLGEYERIHITTGDYKAKFLLPDGSWFVPNVAIERKMNLTELAGNFLYENRRFEREFNRAKEEGLKIYLLIENQTMDDLYTGRYYSKIHPNSLRAFVLSWLTKYNCQLLFCESNRTGKLIREILYREGKEALLKLDQ